MILNTGYEAIMTGILSAVTAQLIKVFAHLLTHRKFNFKIFTTTGGMPSSHTAGVVALSTSIGIIEGFDSSIFAVAIGYAIVVMYDAAGLRRAAGKTAATLNRLVRDFQEHNGYTNPYGVLKELLGHTPKQVYCGALYGVCVAILMHNFLLYLTIKY